MNSWTGIALVALTLLLICGPPNKANLAILKASLTPHLASPSFVRKGVAGADGTAKRP
jgi:hypothetical protein